MMINGMAISELDKLLGGEKERRPKIDPAQIAAQQSISAFGQPTPRPAPQYSPAQEALSMDPIYGSPAAKPNPNYDGTKLPWYVSQLMEALGG